MKVSAAIARIWGFARPATNLYCFLVLQGSRNVDVLIPGLYAERVAKQLCGDGCSVPVLHRTSTASVSQLRIYSRLGLARALGRRCRV